MVWRKVLLFCVFVWIVINKIIHVTSFLPLFIKVVTALGKTFHPEHFTCAHCRQELGSKNFYEREGQPYCEDDYHALYSPRCAYCNGPILDVHINLQKPDKICFYRLLLIRIVCYVIVVLMYILTIICFYTTQTHHYYLICRNVWQLLTQTGIRSTSSVLTVANSLVKMGFMRKMESRIVVVTTCPCSPPNAEDAQNLSLTIISLRLMHSGIQNVLFVG